MARITHVKKAQQRYRTVPQSNPDGTPKVVQVLGPDPLLRELAKEHRGLTKRQLKRVAAQWRREHPELVSQWEPKPKLTKTGKPVTRRLTAPDLTQPLPMPKCEACGKEIGVGQPYKHVTPKTSAYGGRTRYRCGTCPSWQPWDLSNSLSARIQQIQQDNSATVDASDDEDTARAYFTDAAEAVRDLAIEKREAAENLESGFGHATSQSDELNEIAENLDCWADELEGAPDSWYYPDRQDYASDEEYAEALETWAAEATNALEEALGNAPY